MECLYIEIGLSALSIALSYFVLNYKAKYKSIKAFIKSLDATIEDDKISKKEIEDLIRKARRVFS